MKTLTLLLSSLITTPNGEQIKHRQIVRVTQLENGMRAVGVIQVDCEANVVTHGTEVILSGHEKVATEQLTDFINDLKEID